MRIGNNGRFHLTYCTKIHRANGWSELFEAIKSYVPTLKSHLSPDQPFGIGLRLSATASAQLLEPSRLRAFKAFLADHDLYVFTMNGFPFGDFYGPPVKAQIFAPDWQDEQRVQYTLRLIEILRQLLPEGAEGSISTLPLSYKSWVLADDEEKAMERIVRNLLCVVEALIHVRKEYGCTIHLDIEPEPDGLVENIGEFIQFYQKWLQPCGVPLLAKSLQVNVAEARRYVEDYLRLCLDTCHLAVAYEEPADVLRLLAEAGIGIGKVQITSGLRVPIPKTREKRTDLSRCLSRFAESDYLHQVIGRRADGSGNRFPDLCQALPHLEECRDDEWRIHYHMPLFVEDYQMLHSTQSETVRLLQLLKETGFTRHLEIETYTWEQLPADLKTPLHDSLLQEYRFVLSVLEEKMQGTK